MAVELRDYQRRAVNDVLRAWHGGTQRVCLVAPTASGKAVMAAEVVRRARESGARVLAFAHRRELVAQLVGHFGEEAGAICPGFEPRHGAPIQVATVQTLLAREGMRPEAGLVVWDEAHHASPTGEFRAVLDAYPDARVLGLTATPERGDGQPLGDVFDGLVVAAQYSELLAAGHIVPCRVYAPTSDLGSGKLAQCPVEAYRRYGEERLAFCFVSYVEQAIEIAQAFRGAGIAAAVVHGETPNDERAGTLEAFRAGLVRVLVNVYTMTEGTDVPPASCCILARNVGHASTFMQMAGRVLRTAPGKTDAVMIDLSGATHKHGLPTDDRHYSLDGEAMTVKRQRSLTVCKACGYTFESGPRECPRCGHAMPTKINLPTIYDFELREVYRGAATSTEHKERECQRLCRLAAERKWSASWVAKEYAKLFGAPPPAAWLDREALRAEYVRLVNLGRERGYKANFAKARYHALFGTWPT